MFDLTFNYSLYIAKSTLKAGNGPGDEGHKAIASVLCILYHC